MALKKVTWFGVGTLRALGISKGRTRVVESRLISSAIYQSYGSGMVVQDARTGTVEYLGDIVTRVQLQRLSPKGFAKNLSEPTLTVLAPPQPATKEETEPRITLEAAPAPEVEESAQVDEAETNQIDEEVEFGTIKPEKDELPPVSLESLLEEPDYLDEVEIEEPQATEATAVDWISFRRKLLTKSKADLKELAEFYALSTGGTKPNIADRFEDIKDDVDLTLLD